IFFYLYLFRGALGYFFKIQFDLYTQITAPDTPPTSAGSSSATPEKTSESFVAEYIAKLAEDIIHIAGMTAPAASAHSCMAKPVILSSFVTVTEHFVSFRGFLEFFFGSFIARI